jgi:hypothetical protein
MKAEHPEWLLLGCAAHALSLLIKDLGDAKQGKCRWMQKIYSTALMMSNTINGTDKVRAALDHHQLQRPGGKVDAISVHCPTRFGTMHFICQDLIANKDAIRAMVMDDGDDTSWDHVAKDSEHSDEFLHAALGTSPRARAAPFKWQELQLAIELVQPIMDGIHELECDSPRLSWVLPFWAKLIAHARQFDEHHGGTIGADLVPIVKARMDKHYDVAWPAAYVLDPMFAVQGIEGWYLPFTNDIISEAKAEDALQCVKELAGAGNEAAVEEEFTRLRLAPLPLSMARDLPVLTRRSRRKDGREVVAAATMRRAWWDRNSVHFPHTARAAIKLLSFHVTSCSSERNWSRWGRLCTKASNRRGLERSEKLVAISSRGGSAPDIEQEDELMLRLLEQN